MPIRHTHTFDFCVKNKYVKIDLVQLVGGSAETRSETVVFANAGKYVINTNTNTSTRKINEFLPSSEATIIQWSLHIATVQMNTINTIDSDSPNRTRRWKRYSSNNIFLCSLSKPPNVDVDILPKCDVCFVIVTAPNRKWKSGNFCLCHT